MSDGDKKFPVLRLNDLYALPYPEWLIPQIIPANAVGVLAGRHSSGKSFLALEMMTCLACGTPFLGHECNPYAVLYAFGEGGTGIKNRMKSALSRMHGINEDHFYFLQSAPQLHVASDVKLFGEAVCALKPRPKLIIIDTLAQAFVGGEENSAKDMGLLFNGAKRICQLTGATVLIVHHVGKDKFGSVIRGSSVLECNADFIMMILSKKLQSIKLKDASKFPSIPFHLRQVELGEGQSSMIVEKVDGIDSLTDRDWGPIHDKIITTVKDVGENGISPKRLQERIQQGMHISDNKYYACLRAVKGQGFLLEDNLQKVKSIFIIVSYEILLLL